MITPDNSTPLTAQNPVSAESQAAEAYGGEALQGSGFENEQPETAFDERI
ncbi:MAG: hypothetical protein IPP47_33095 [Bryobacterales bacterium]|nr:hypothetical protein [Bryobacterales bacterium]